MKSFRSRMFGPALFVFLVSAVAIQPGIAQQEQATHVFHRLIPAGDTCASCHKVVYEQWKAGPHGANGVDCTMCHGETTSKDFAGIPALSACESCHAEQVAQLKSEPFLKGKTCVNCHQAHTFLGHQKAATAGE